MQIKVSNIFTQHCLFYIVLMYFSLVYLFADNKKNVLESNPPAGGQQQHHAPVIRPKNKNRGNQKVCVDQ